MNFEKLTEEVLKQQLGTARMTDAKIGHIYSIVGEDDAPELASDKKHSIPTSFAAIAALRVADNEEAAAKVDDTRTARDAAGVKNLQYCIQNEAVKLTADLKLKVVKKIKIKDAANNDWVYRNECYNGYADYLDKCAEINETLPALPASDANFKTRRTARQTAFTKATNALRASKVRTGFEPVAANLQMMPLFVISA